MGDSHAAHSPPKCPPEPSQNGAGVRVCRVRVQCAKVVL